MTTTRALTAIIIAALLGIAFIAGYLTGHSDTTTIATDATQRTMLFTGAPGFHYTPDQPSSYGPTTA